MNEQHNILTTPTLRVRLRSGEEAIDTLPQLFIELLADEVLEFTALRPHQRMPLHAFLVQLAALALSHAQLIEPPTTEELWRKLLRDLTSEWPNDEPWMLVVDDITKPALLQPALSSSFILEQLADTPDALDILVTSKNHDLKAKRMRDAQPEDWFYALLTLQTQQSYLGRGNYGIARMNKGSSNRSFVGIVPPGGPGARWRRDLRAALHLRAKLLQYYPSFRAHGGLGLMWLKDWANDDQIRMDELDPFFIEVCRRIRLSTHKGFFTASKITSKKRTFEGDKDTSWSKGITGDLWAPIDLSDEKSLSVTASGFSYSLISEIMFGKLDKRLFKEAPLQLIQSDDPKAHLNIHFSGLARRPGKTEGFHERTIPISVKAANYLLDSQGSKDKLAKLSKILVQDAKQFVQKILKPSLFRLFKDAGEQKIDFNHKDTLRKAQRYLDSFDEFVDQSFFENLWKILDRQTSAECQNAQIAWLRELQDYALSLIRTAAYTHMRSPLRYYRALAKAENFFFACSFKVFAKLRTADVQLNLNKRSCFTENSSLTDANADTPNTIPPPQLQTGVPHA